MLKNKRNQDNIQSYLLDKKQSKIMKKIIEQLIKYGIQDTIQTFLKTHFNLKFQDHNLKQITQYQVKSYIK